MVSCDQCENPATFGHTVIGADGEQVHHHLCDEHNAALVETIRQEAAERQASWDNDQSEPPAEAAQEPS